MRDALAGRPRRQQVGTSEDEVVLREMTSKDSMGTSGDEVGLQETAADEYTAREKEKDMGTSQDEVVVQKMTWKEMREQMRDCGLIVLCAPCVLLSGLCSGCSPCDFICTLPILNIFRHT